MEINDIQTTKTLFPDAIQKPIKIKFWSPTRGLWITVTIRMTPNDKEPFGVWFKGTEMKPFVHNIEPLDPVRFHSTLDAAMETAKSYIRLWATEDF